MGRHSLSPALTAIHTGVPSISPSLRRAFHWTVGQVGTVSQQLFRQFLTPHPHPVDPSGESDAPAIFAWLETLSLVPRYLLPRDEGVGSPPLVRDLKYERGGQGGSTYTSVLTFVDWLVGRPFCQNHCGSVLQYLTSDLADGRSDTWFVSAGSTIQQVSIHPPTSANNISPTFLTISELSSCPFPIYKHRQSIGDLLIIPASW